MSIRVYGNVISPYARKVYLALEWKELPFEAIDVLPHDSSQPFTDISRLGKIPAFADDQIALSDSTVICDYLESRYPDPPLYPTDPAERARALWIEEFADTHLQDLLLRGVVLERLIKPNVRGEPTDVARVDAILASKLPPELDYLEALMPDGSSESQVAEASVQFLVGDQLSIADVALTTCFITAASAQWTPDAERCPRLVRYLDTMVKTPLFAARAEAEANYMASLG